MKRIRTLGLIGVYEGQGTCPAPVVLPIDMRIARIGRSTHAQSLSIRTTDSVI